MQVLDETVDSVMRRWPATIRVFLDFGARCVGCPIGRFHTVEEACAVHAIDAQTFAAALDRSLSLRTEPES